MINLLLIYQVWEKERHIEVYGTLWKYEKKKKKKWFVSMPFYPGNEVSVFNIKLRGFIWFWVINYIAMHSS